MMEQELKIAAVEGNSFSGKTTLVRGMKDAFFYETIEEYDVYAGGSSNFPNFPPENYSQARKSIDYFIELEKRRSGDAIDKASRTNKVVLMDRSFYSCISFQYVVKNTMPNVPNAYLYSLESLFKLTQKSEVVIPSVLIYMEPENSEILLKRIAKRGRVSIDFLNEQTSFDVMHLWYYDLVYKYYKKDNSLLIKGIENNLELNLQEANSFILSADFGLDKVPLVSELAKL